MKRKPLSKEGREPNSNFCHKCRKWVETGRAPKSFNIVWTCEKCASEALAND